MMTLNKMTLINQGKRILWKACLVILVSCVSGCGRQSLPANIEPKQVFSREADQQIAQAAYSGTTQDVVKAIANGADPNAVGKLELTPLWIAYYGRNRQSFEALLSHGANAEQPDGNGEPLLGIALFEKQYGFAEAALAAGANPNAINRISYQPVLFRTITGDAIEGIQLMQRYKADLNIRQKDGSTAAVYASNTRQMRILKFLMDHGADPTIQNDVKMDVAAGLFAPNWIDSGPLAKLRLEILADLESRGFEFDYELIAKANIANLPEATGNQPPKWFKGSNDLNPEWVKAFPEDAEAWYRTFRPDQAPHE